MPRVDFNALWRLGLSKTQLRRAILVPLIALWYSTSPTEAVLGYCDQVCTYDVSCNESCLYNYDDLTTCGLWGTCYDPGYCGDGFCGEVDGENVDNCADDCFIGPGPTPPPDEPTCGDSRCEVGESNRNCPADCSLSNPVTCGDAICEGTETGSNCSADCTYADFCTSANDCPTWSVCRVGRCVWDPGATTCLSSTSGAPCASNQRCVQIGTSGYGICVNVF